MRPDKDHPETLGLRHAGRPRGQQHRPRDAGDPHPAGHGELLRPARRPVAAELVGARRAALHPQLRRQPDRAATQARHAGARRGRRRAGLGRRGAARGLLHAAAHRRPRRRLRRHLRGRLAALRRHPPRPLRRARDVRRHQRPGRRARGAAAEHEARAHRGDRQPHHPRLRRRGARRDRARARARCCRSTPPSPRHRSTVRSITAPTSSCTRSPSSSTATATRWAVS